MTIGIAGTPDGMIARTSPLFLREEELDRALELLLLADRRLATGARTQTAAVPHEGDLRLLWLIQRHPGATLAELGAVLGVAKQSMSRHLQALVRAGLASREEDGADRRRRPLRLTAAGAVLVATTSERRKLLLRQAFQASGPEAVAGFLRVLDALADGVGRRLPGRRAG